MSDLIAFLDGCQLPHPLFGTARGSWPSPHDGSSMMWAVWFANMAMRAFYCRHRSQWIGSDPRIDARRLLGAARWYRNRLMMQRSHIVGAQQTADRKYFCTKEEVMTEFEFLILYPDNS